MTELIELTVAETGQGERLDRWLADQMVEVSRSRLQALITAGLVWRNGALCKAKEILKTGDQIRVELPETVALDLTAEPMNLQILYEDAHLLVLDKPAGLVVHPAPGHGTGTLVHGLLAHCHDLSGINGVARPGILHRLDKDTSGLMVIAKHDQAHQHLQAQIQAKTAQRSYLGVVHGGPKVDSGLVDAAIARHPVHRLKMAVVPTGREARTHWRVLERLPSYSLLRFDLETGRTHQIRVHSQHLGYPIVGDPLYCPIKPPIKLTGQALHAFRLAFEHPVTHEELAFESSPPAIFQKLLRYLGSGHEV